MEDKSNQNEKYKISGKTLPGVIEKNPQIAEFAKGFYQLIHSKNQQHQECKPNLYQRRLDTFARLLVGDEICAAVALSKEKIWIASNKNLHLKDFIQYDLYLKLTGLNENLAIVCIVAKCQYHCFSETGEELPTLEYDQSSDNIVYEIIPSNKQLKLQGNKTKFTIDIPYEKHQTKDFGEFPLKISCTLKNVVKVELSNVIMQSNTVSFLTEIPDTRMYDFFSKEFSIGKELQLFEPRKISLNPLRRRVGKMFTIASTFAFLKQSNDHSFKESAKTQLPKLYFEFLTHSLSWELSKVYKFNPLDCSDNNPMSKLSVFYEELMISFSEFSKSHRDKIKSSKAFVDIWFKLILGVKFVSLKLILADKEFYDLELKNLPEFIKEKPTFFLEKLRRYLIDLMRLENFIQQPPKEAVPLIQALLNPKLIDFKNIEAEKPIEVIDGLSGEHAEMRLVAKHLSEFDTIDEYYGITMLCCAHCTWVMSTFEDKNFIRRGSHAQAFDGWTIDPVFLDPKHWKQLLGEKLYKLYEELSNQPFYEPNAKQQIEKTKRGTQGEIMQKIISSITVMNAYITTPNHQMVEKPNHPMVEKNQTLKSFLENLQPFPSVEQLEPELSDSEEEKSYSLLFNEEIQHKNSDDKSNTHQSIFSKFQISPSSNSTNTNNPESILDDVGDEINQSSKMIMIDKDFFNNFEDDFDDDDLSDTDEDKKSNYKN